MNRSGILEVENENGETVAVRFITRDNFDSFVIDKLADSETVLSISEDDEDGSAIMQVKSGRRPYTLKYVPRVTDHVPKLRLNDETIKILLSVKR